jgi:predicted GIY-YIG superfamily endonuclease
MPRPQTIQIFLPAGDPRGMRVAEITTRIVRVVEVPRSQLGEFLKMPEALQVSVYFLIGELSDTGLPRVYIGQTGNVGKRLVQHNQDTDRGKDFWNRALVVVSLTNSMTQTHALFLAGRALQPGERQRGSAAPHACAARGRLPRDPRDRRQPAGHAGPADF